MKKKRTSQKKRSRKSAKLLPPSLMCLQNFSLPKFPLCPSLSPA